MVGEWPLATGWPTITLAVAVLWGLIGFAFCSGLVLALSFSAWLAKRPALDADIEMAGRKAFPNA